MAIRAQKSYISHIIIIGIAIQMIYFQRNSPRRRMFFVPTT